MPDPSSPPPALHLGDNLAVLRERVADASVDLVYLDPPFNSNRSYSAVFRGEAVGKARPTALAFDDAFRWDAAAEAACEALCEGSPHGSLAPFLRAMRSLLGPGDLLAYLVMMAPRLAELRRALRPTGSLFLHCDPGASHYLKLLMDAVFGADCFRNEVIWRYRRWPSQSTRFQRMHDVLLFYTRTADGSHTFHTLYGYERLADSTLKAFGTRRQVADFSSGRRKPGVVAEATEGPPLSDVWEVGILAPSGKERVGYPTQKPEALLERVVRAASNPGDVVLDPFCGSGTTLVVAERLGRRWVGIDASPLALSLAASRLAQARPPEATAGTRPGTPAAQGARAAAAGPPLARTAPGRRRATGTGGSKG
jgi:site-specific DNA-methyltransferase (adenine-specific)